ncbi:hypothetical protein U8V72_17430 [Priestia filamentosa]|uniref:hypothetical protein n=1 Tax=Priestia filamentosa TaxID=1402861 RepID=UPI0039781970
MLKKTMTILGLSALAISATGCQNEGTKEEKQTKQEETSPDSVGVASENYEDQNDGAEKVSSVNNQEIVFGPEMKIKNEITTLFKNSEGTIDYVGFDPKNMNDNFTLVLQATGDLRKAEIDDTAFSEFSFTLDDGSAIKVTHPTSIRIKDEKKFYVFETEEPVQSRKVIKVEGTVYPTGTDLSAEREPFSVDVKSQKGTVTIPALSFPQATNVEVNDTRENDEAKVTLSNISTTSIEPGKIKVEGILEYKKDKEGMPRINFLQPDLMEFSSQFLKAENTNTNFARNTKVKFSNEFDLGNPLGKNQNENVYIAVEGQLFAYNVRTGKEIKNPDMTFMVRENEELAKSPEYPIVDGFTDVKDNHLYDAVLLKAIYSASEETDKYAKTTFGVGGYKTLKFKLGNPKEMANEKFSYDVYVYGSDFKVSEDGKTEGKVLLKKTVTNETALEDVEVDVSNQSNVTLFYVANGLKEAYTYKGSLILSSVKLEK